MDFGHIDKHLCLVFVAKTVQTKFDASTLHNNTALAAESQMFDDGTGKVEVGGPAGACPVRTTGERK